MFLDDKADDLAINENISNNLGDSILKSLGESSDEATPERYRSLDDVYASCLFALTVTYPYTFDEAVKNQEWRNAMSEEMNSILKNNT